MNSYCYCNTMYTIHPETKMMEVRAQRNIARGEEISTRYILPSMEQPARLETIHKAWGFICTCARCGGKVFIFFYNSQSTQQSADSSQ